MQIEVVYALPAAADLTRLTLDAGCSAIDAVRASGVLARHPELHETDLLLGVFGRRVRADTRLNPGDRVEIYRALRNDPMAQRRARAPRKR